MRLSSATPRCRASPTRRRSESGAWWMSASVRSSHSGLAVASWRRTPWSIPHTFPAQPSGRGSPVITSHGRAMPAAASRATAPVPSDDRSSTTTTRMSPG